MTRRGSLPSVDSPDALLLSARSRRRAVRCAGWRGALALAAGLVAIVVSCGGLASPAGATAAGDAVTTGHPARVLVLSVPGLTWADVRDHDLPNLERLLGDAALADLAPRGVSARSTPGAAYLTISAGSRATSDPLVDGQQLAIDERSGSSTAGDIFRRRTGVEPDGAYVSLAWPMLSRANADEPYDTKLGLLADTLDAAGRGAVAIGNADGTDTAGVSFERQVGLSAVTHDGVVPGGELGDDLLVSDATRPFGRRLDIDRVVEAFRAAWRAPDGRTGGMVLVEASDLARTMRYRDRVSRVRYDQLRADALADTDELVGRLVASVDARRDAVLLVAPYNLLRDRDLTVAALRAPGRGAGYLRSASTQRAGFLTLVDVAPTVLDVLGVDRPAGMEGRPAEVVSTKASLTSRVDHLVSLNAAALFREELLFPTTLAVVVALTAVCAAAVVVIARGGWPRVSGVVTFAALAELAVLPLSYVARAFPLEDLGAAFYWGFTVAAALAFTGAATVVAARLGRPRLALVAVLAAVLAVPTLDVVTGSHLSLSAAFGYSATGNSRLYGISNYSFGQVAAASCLLAGMLASTSPGRRRRWAAVALLLAVLVVIGVPVWGSDVGGILAFTPTVLVFAVLVFQGRIRWRTVVIGGLATVASVTAFGLLDLARPPTERSHLGRLFERVRDEGLRPLTDIVERKALANLSVTTTSFWVAAIPVAIAFIVFLTRYPGRPLVRVHDRIPRLQAGLVAGYVAALLGSAVNDSGAIVGGVTLTVLAATLAVLALEPVPAAPAARAPDASTGEVATSEAGPTAVEPAPAPPVPVSRARGSRV